MCQDALFPSSSPQETMSSQTTRPQFQVQSCKKGIKFQFYAHTLHTHFLFYHLSLDWFIQVYPAFMRVANLHQLTDAQLQRQRQAKMPLPGGRLERLPELLGGATVEASLGSTSYV